MSAWSRGLHRLYTGVFVSRAAAPLWLLPRIYLAMVWIGFGMAKIRGGWLTTNPVGGLLEAVASGSVPQPVEGYGAVAGLLLRLGVDPLLSVLIPLFEIVAGSAFLCGVLLRPVAVAATLLNLNLILSGFASWSFDGRIILLQLLLLAGWRAASRIGLAAPLGRAAGRLRGPARSGARRRRGGVRRVPLLQPRAGA